MLNVVWVEEYCHLRASLAWIAWRGLARLYQEAAQCALGDPADP